MRQSTRDLSQIVENALDGDGRSCWSVRCTLLQPYNPDSHDLHNILIERDIDPSPIFAESLLIKGALEGGNGHCCWTLTQAIIRPDDADSKLRLDALQNYGHTPTRALADKLIVQGAIDGDHPKCCWLTRHAILDSESERSTGRIQALRDRNVEITPAVADAFLLKSSLSGHEEAMAIASSSLRFTDNDLSRSLLIILQQTGINITQQLQNSLNSHKRAARDNTLPSTVINSYQKSLSRFIQPGLQITQ
jgi:hypothetical protein